MSTVRTSLAAAELGELAVTKSANPAVRQLGTEMTREQSALRAAAGALAQKKALPVPDGVEERKAARKENLAGLFEDFDRGYVLAAVQDLNAEVSALEQAASKGDADVKQFAQQQLPALRARQQAVTAMLNQMGGSPFNVPP